MEMRKFPKIRRPGHEKADGIGKGEVVVLEKLDGANFRFRWTGDEWLFGSRNVEFKEDGEPSDEQVNKQFQHAVDYVKKHAKPSAVDTDLSRYTFYGEAMHEHKIDYDSWDGKHPDPDTEFPPNVAVFDVYDEVDEKWCHWDDILTLTDSVSLYVVSPIQEADTIDEMPDVPRSLFRDDKPDADNEFDCKGLAEGIVVRRIDGTARAKKVHDDFRETKSQSSDDITEAQSEAAEFVAMYVTKPRIEKQAYKLVDEGEYDSLKMEMMQDLPRCVLEDVMAEEGWDILNNGLELDEDTKAQIRKKASSKCATVLKQELATL